MLPVLVHQLAEADQIPGLQGLFAAVSQILDVIQIAQHIGVACLGAHLLILQYGARGAGEAGEKQQQIVLELEHRLSRHAQRLDGDAVILVEGEANEAAKCRDVLILLTDRVLQALDLYVASVFGQFPGMGRFCAGAHRAPSAAPW